ncbi:MAG: murein L,D-transpeptidase catalytic domain family protein [Sphingomonas sp.]|nr:murein L,D-transpeptidase catalytic domain family protein [Sphingomonas sp.]
MRAEGQMTLNRREMLRWGAVGGGAAIVSSAAGSMGIPSIVYNAPPPPRVPLVPAAPQVLQAPGGINPQLFQRAKAALDTHRIAARDTMAIVDFGLASGERRFHLVDLRNGDVQTYRVTHGKGSDPSHNGFLDSFSNTPGSEATSNGTYTTGEYYHGKYGLSMKLHGHDWSNNNALSRAIVIHNAWYAEPDVVQAHGKLGRSQGCFAFSRRDQYEIMKRIAGGRMLYADKLA